MAESLSPRDQATSVSADHQKLREWLVRGSPAQRVRAAIVLERARGASFSAIALRLGIHRDTVRRWLARYQLAGIAGLFHGNAGQDRPRRFDAVRCDRIREIASKAPGEVGEPFSQWSLYKLRSHLVRAGVVEAISIERLRQILQATGGRPASWRGLFPDRIPLAPDTRQELQRVARDPTVGLRAEIVLAAGEGRPAKAIAVDLGTSANTARRWVRRFIAGGIGALTDSPVRGQATVFTPLVRADIAAIAARPPGELGLSKDRWSLYSLRAYLISHQIVGRISIEWLRQILLRANGPTGAPLGSLSAPTQVFPLPAGGIPPLSRPSPVTGLARNTPATRLERGYGAHSGAARAGAPHRKRRAPAAGSVR